MSEEAFQFLTILLCLPVILVFIFKWFLLSGYIYIPLICSALNP
jgi:hypothetical protein